MTDPKDDSDDLSRLQRELHAARQTSDTRSGRAPARGGAGPALGMAMRIGVEMVAGVAVGAGMGYFLDRWLGTSPVLLIVLFFLGAGAGALNTYRAAGKINADDRSDE